MLCRLIFVLALSTQALMGSELKSEKVNSWTEGPLAPQEGAFVVQSTLIDLAAQTRNSAVTFWLSSQTDQSVYRVELPGDPRDSLLLWPLKAGTYDLIRIRTIDSEGRDWNWRPQNPQVFHIEAETLSNLGNWFLVEVKKGKKLNLLIKPIRYQPLLKLPPNLRRIIDGETRAEVLNVSSKPNQGKLDTSLTTQGPIDLKVDLFRQSSQEPLMTQILQSRSQDLQACFQEYQTRNPQVSGLLAFTFIYSASEHSIKSLKIKQAELRDQRFLTCMIDTIKQLNFPIEKSLIGEMSFSFQRKGS